LQIYCGRYSGRYGKEYPSHTAGTFFPISNLVNQLELALNAPRISNPSPLTRMFICVTSKQAANSTF
jgi:hypothetical protein